MISFFFLGGGGGGGGGANSESLIYRVLVVLLQVFNSTYVGLSFKEIISVDWYYLSHPENYCGPKLTS